MGRVQVYHQLSQLEKEYFALNGKDVEHFIKERLSLQLAKFLVDRTELKKIEHKGTISYSMTINFDEHFMTGED